MSDVSATLNERAVNYGKFITQAWYAQAIKNVFHNSPQWDGMDTDMKESLEMIANKIGRILNGNPAHIDSWHDIAGYAKLVEDRLNGVVQ